MLSLLALWIGMSAQAQIQWASQPSTDCSFGELITVGQNQVVAMCLGGKWVVSDWVAKAAQDQRDSGETDGLTHCMKSDGTPCVAADETDGKPREYQKPVDLYPVMCADSETRPHPCNQPVERVCRLRQLIKHGEMETYVLDCVPEVKP